MVRQNRIPHKSVQGLNGLWLGVLLCLLLSVGLSAPALAASTASSAVVLLGGSSGINGQASATTDIPTDPDAINAMVSRLTDKEVRDLLLQRLDAVATEKAADSPKTSLLAFASDTLQKMAASIFQTITLLPAVVTLQSESFARFADKHGQQGVLNFIEVVLLAVVIGWVVEKGVRYLLDSLCRPWLVKPETLTLVKKLKILGLKFLLALVGIVVFTVLALVVIKQGLVGEDLRFMRMVVADLIIFPRFMWIVLVFVFSPKDADLRLVGIDNWTARFFCLHLGMIFLLICTNSIISSFNRMNGLGPSDVRIGFWVNLGIHIYLMMIAWKARAGLTRMLLGESADVTHLENKLAHAFPFFIIFLSGLTWLVTESVASMGRFDLLKDGPQYTTMILLLMIPALDTLIRWLVGHLIGPLQGEGLLAEEAHSSNQRSYIRIGRTLMFAVFMLVISDVWGVRFEDLAMSGMGAQAASHLFGGLYVFIAGYLVWELVTLFINHKLAAERTASGIDLNNEESGGEGGGAGASRLSTILPLVRFVLQGLIITITLLAGLGSLGVDTTPLLAGAGIVGIAIGFGAQKLVTDVISGIFYLIDDAFREGEYLSIGTTVGTVEKISLRSFQLRHHRGALHTIPYGQIPTLTNYSRDWVIMKLRFTVPFDTDLTKVKKIFKKIGQEMLEIPEYKEDFLQPFKSQGALEVDDVGIVIRGKFMAKPGTQFVLRREINQRIQQAFDENGLQFARKEVRVRIDDTHQRQWTDAERQAIAAAASDAAEKPVPVA